MTSRNISTTICVIKMKKSRKQRKLETAKRVAAEEAERKWHKQLDECQAAVDKLKNTIIGQMGLPKSIFEQPEKEPDRYIVMAAIKHILTDKVYSVDSSSYHSDIRSEYRLPFEDRDYVNGFLDNRGNFLTRTEAGEIAYKAGQCTEYCKDNLQSNQFTRYHYD